MAEYKIHESLKGLALEKKKTLHISQNEGKKWKDG